MSDVKISTIEPAEALLQLAREMTPEQLKNDEAMQKTLRTFAQATDEDTGAEVHDLLNKAGVPHYTVPVVKKPDEFAMYDVSEDELNELVELHVYDKVISPDCYAYDDREMSWYWLGEDCMLGDEGCCREARKFTQSIELALAVAEEAGCTYTILRGCEGIIIGHVSRYGAGTVKFEDARHLKNLPMNLIRAVIPEAEGQRAADH